MEDTKIKRINQLAKKSREQGLTPEEKQEQQTLRQEYIHAFRQSMIAQLDSLVIVDEKGNRRKVTKRQNLS